MYTVADTVVHTHQERVEAGVVEYVGTHTAQVVDHHAVEGTGVHTVHGDSEEVRIVVHQGREDTAEHVVEGASLANEACLDHADSFRKVG